MEVVGYRLYDRKTPVRFPRGISGLFSKRPGRAWVPPSFLINKHSVPFHWGETFLALNLGTLLHIGSRIRTSGAITLRISTLSYRDQGQLYRFLTYRKKLSFDVFVIDIYIQIQARRNKRGANTGNTNGWFRRKSCHCYQYIFKVDKLLNLTATKCRR